MHARQARLARRATAIQLLVAASPAVMVTAVMSVAKSHHRQTARVAEGLPDTDGSKINPKQTLVTSSDAVPRWLQRLQRLTMWLANPGKEDAQNHC